MISVQISAGDRVRLYCDDERLAAILDAWWKEHHGKGEFPSAGYSAAFDADAYDMTAEQLVTFLASRLGVSTPTAPAPAATHRTKQPISEAQRQARRENAQKAARARRKHHTNHTV